MRRAIRDRRALALDYRDEQGVASKRTVRPLALAFSPPVWLLIAWCELRTDFRNSRLDRCVWLEVTERRFADEPGKRLADFLARMTTDRERHERR